MGGAESAPLLKLVAEIDRVHSAGSAEFCVRDWLSRYLGEFAFSDDVGELELRLWQETVALTPMPGVVAALGRIAGAGLRLACVSNAAFSARALDRNVGKAQISYLGCRKPPGLRELPQ